MLHEILMTLSGVSGSFLKELVENDNVMDPGECMLIKRVLDISSQYMSIKTFIDRNMFLLGTNSHKDKQGEEDQRQQFGMYLQAFCNGLREVLVPYHKDIVELEEKALEDPYLPLLTIISKVEEYSKLFGILNYAISQISLRQIHGCQMLDFMQGELNCSDDVKDAVQSIILCCQLVFLKQLSSWLLYGQLIDRYGEFFIQPMSNAEGQASTSTTLDSFSSQDINEAFLSDMRKSDDETGYHRYCLRLSMLPSKLDIKLAQKILFIGENILMFGTDPKEKSDMLFISSRYTSSIWGKREVEFHQKLQNLQTMKSFKSTEFEKTINEFRSCITEHLWKLAVEEAELFLQLKLMKDFFLLGRGELFLEFICQAGHILQNPALSTSTRDVNQAFHVAAHKISINEETINKFNLLIPYKADIEPNDLKENCWEKLRLSYAVSWPLHTLFDDNVLENYNKLFNFLLQVKRTQLNLHSIWKDHVKSKTRGVILGESSVWHLRNNLMFLIDNLQYYFQVDVLESQYTELQSKVQMTKDFEEVQQLHNKFLSDIMSRTFLSVDTVTIGSETKPNPVNVVLKKVLAMGEKFCSSVHSWDESLHEGEFLELHDMVKEYECLVMYLLRLLSELSSYSCGSHLSQFLLRLDFNRWFSTQHNIVPSV